MAITGGFQDAFRNKILGVNAHVLVLKYGLDFSEYREVMAHAEELPEVAAAAPFVIHEMMLAKGDRLSGVLVKGLDPDRLGSVMELPSQMRAGSLEGLRLPGREPPIRDATQHRELMAGEEDLDAYLRALSNDEPVPTTEAHPMKAPPVATVGAVAVPTPEEMEAALAGNEISGEESSYHD